jgi:carboxylesterase type B
MEDIQNGLDTHICTQYMPFPFSSDMEAKDGEDCLFLDVTVPGAALRDTTIKLPVLDWIYGGAYVAGSKEIPFVEISKMQPEHPLTMTSGAAETMVSHGNNSFIWVAGNYRVSTLLL